MEYFPINSTFKALTIIMFVCTDIADLDMRDRKLDDLIHSATVQLKMLTEDPENARYPFQNQPTVGLP